MYQLLVNRDGVGLARYCGTSESLSTSLIVQPRTCSAGELTFVVTGAESGSVSDYVQTAPSVSVAWLDTDDVWQGDPGLVKD